MIQFNLLPDVKLEHLKAQRAQRTVSSIALMVMGGAIVLLVLLFSFSQFQKSSLKKMSAEIAAGKKTLQKKPDIDKILTVQNQLASLSDLHTQKPAASQLFGYLSQVTPAAVSISNVNLDFNAHTVTISGNADALVSVNKYIDTLKLTKFTSTAIPATTEDSKTKPEASKPAPAFTDVVLSSFSLSTGAADTTQVNNRPATFSIAFTYDQAIFTNTNKVTLKVPVITNRAQVQDPDELFQADTTKTGGTQ